MSKRPAGSSPGLPSAKHPRLFGPSSVSRSNSTCLPLTVPGGTGAPGPLGERTSAVSEGDISLSQTLFRDQDDSSAPKRKASKSTCQRNFFRLSKHVDAEAYKPQIAAQTNQSTHRRRWYKLHKAIVEFSIYSEAHVVLELLMNGETVRVLSTWDLEGVKISLEVDSTSDSSHFVQSE